MFVTSASYLAGRFASRPQLQLKDSGKTSVCCELRGLCYRLQDPRLNRFTCRETPAAVLCHSSMEWFVVGLSKT